MTCSVDFLRELKDRTILSWAGDCYGRAIIRWMNLDQTGNYGYVIERNEEAFLSPVQANLIRESDQLFHEIISDNPGAIERICGQKKQEDSEDKLRKWNFFIYFLQKTTEKYSKKVPSIVNGGEIFFPDIDIISEWENTPIEVLTAARVEAVARGKEVEQVLNKWKNDRPDIFEKISLLRKTDGETFWKITIGKNQTIYGYLKFLCIFPRANEKLLVEETPPIRWPSVIKEANPDFIKDHDLKEIDHAFRSTISSVEFVKKLVFTRRYQTAKSKFDPSVYVSPYEYGVTIIAHAYTNTSKTRESKSEEEDSWQIGGIMRPGHLAIILESVKNGTYYAETIDIVFYNKKSFSGCIRMEEAGKKISNERFGFLKDAISAREIFPDLTHSKTWIREKEEIDKMRAHVQKQIDVQRPDKPVVILNNVGKDAFISPFRGVDGVLNV